MNPSKKLPGVFVLIIPQVILPVVCRPSSAPKARRSVKILKDMIFFGLQLECRVLSIEDSVLYLILYDQSPQNNTILCSINICNPYVGPVLSSPLNKLKTHDTWASFCDSLIGLVLLWPTHSCKKKKKFNHRGAHSRFNHSKALGSLTNNGDTFSQVSTWYLFNQTFSASDNKFTSISFVWIGHL